MIPLFYFQMASMGSGMETLRLALWAECIPVVIGSWIFVHLLLLCCRSCDRSSICSGTNYHDVCFWHLNFVLHDLSCNFIPGTSSSSSDVSPDIRCISWESSRWSAVYRHASLLDTLYTACHLPSKSDSYSYIQWRHFIIVSCSWLHRQSFISFIDHIKISCSLPPQSSPCQSVQNKSCSFQIMSSMSFSVTYTIPLGADP